MSTRPTWNDQMQKQFVTAVTQILSGWDHNDEYTWDELHEMTETVLENYTTGDGYELAKEFDDCGLDVTSSLVQELDYVYLYYERDKILEKHVKEWVKNTNQVLEFQVGDKVNVTYRNKPVVGEVVKLYPETMEVGVWCDALRAPRDKTHLLKKSEDVTKITE